MQKTFHETNLHSTKHFFKFHIWNFKTVATYELQDAKIGWRNCETRWSGNALANLDWKYSWMIWIYHTANLVKCFLMNYWLLDILSDVTWMMLNGGKILRIWECFMLSCIQSEMSFWNFNRNLNCFLKWTWKYLYLIQLH